MTLSNIRYFVEVASCESITEAAEKLYISQPGLSKQIALIEKEIGVALFYRTHRTVRLTPAGRLIMVQRIQSGRAVAHVAAEMGISRTTAWRWWRRFRRKWGRRRSADTNSRGRAKCVRRLRRGTARPREPSRRDR